MSKVLSSIPTLRQLYANGTIASTAKKGSTRFAPVDAYLDRVSLMSVPIFFLPLSGTDLLMGAHMRIAIRARVDREISRSLRLMRS